MRRYIETREVERLVSVAETLSSLVLSAVFNIRTNDDADTDFLTV